MCSEAAAAMEGTAIEGTAIEGTAPSSREARGV